jgi:hypothetical protein
MFSNTNKIRRTVTGLVVAASVAGLAGSSALASGNANFAPRNYSTWLAGPKVHMIDGRSPDTRDAAQLSSREYATWLAGPRVQVTDGRSPNTRDAAEAAFARQLTNPQHRALNDGRAPDRRDAARAAFGGQLTNPQHRALNDGRAPDTIDAAVQAHSPVVTIVRTPGFAWSEFGIGAAAACGAMLLLGSIRLRTARRSRKQPGPVAAA